MTKDKGAKPAALSVSSAAAQPASRVTAKQRLILDTLAEHGGCTPTVLGMKCGKPYFAASSWACQAMPALIKAGLVQRKTWRGQVSYELADRNDSEDHTEAEGEATQEARDD